MSNKTAHQKLQQVWANLPGLGVLAAVNHTTVGKRFMLTGMFYFLVAGLFAMLIRTQLALPDQDIVSAEFYAQAFTMHGTLMMFLFAIPVLEGLAMYIIPKMVGARDLIFPRLSAFGYFCYLFGGLILLSSLFIDAAPSTGWFMYTPLSNSEFSPGAGADFWLIGITLIEVSAIAAAVELIVTILRGRTNGMTLRAMPIFCWYILVMSFMILFGFPPLLLASVLLELERAGGWVFFDVEGGGDPLLWQHLFWLFGHPEVYILFLPAAGIISTLIPVFSQRPILGYRWLVLSAILTGFISFGLWVHHMFTVGIPQLAQAFFSIASMLIAIPTAIQIFTWLGTLWVGRVKSGLPMLWIFGFLFVFVIGGLTGVMVALVPFDWQVHDTHFVVAHLHYVTVGGVFFPLIAGIYYWLPHFSGRMSSGRLGLWAFWLIFLGFNITFLIMHLTGLLGMPRRIYSYPQEAGWGVFNLISSGGGFIMAIGVAMLILDFILHFRFGRKASPNPWNADTLEWATQTPPDTYNFASLPTLKSRHPMWDYDKLQDRIQKGDFDLADPQNGLRETFGSDPVSGQAHQIIHLPSNSWLPLQSAGALAIVCIALLAKSYWFAVIAGVVATIILLRWAWLNGAHPAVAPLSEEETKTLPLHSRTADGPAFWGVGTFLLANGTFYFSLIFGWLYLWTVAPNWSLPSQSPISFWPLLVGGIFLSLAVLMCNRVVNRLIKGNERKLGQQFWGITVAGGLHILALLWVLLRADLGPIQSAHDSILAVLFLYILANVTVATILSAMQAVRVRLGIVGVKSPCEPPVLRLLWGYSAGVFWLSFAAFILLPMGWGLS